MGYEGHKALFGASNLAGHLQVQNRRTREEHNCREIALISALTGRLSRLVGLTGVRCLVDDGGTRGCWRLCFKGEVWKEIDLDAQVTISLSPLLERGNFLFEHTSVSRLIKSWLRANVALHIILWGCAVRVFPIERVWGDMGNMTVFYPDDGSWANIHGFLDMSLQIPVAFPAEDIGANQKLECQYTALLIHSPPANSVATCAR
ncbi:hypothetical protein PV04_04315 [Phialophora macrospora]|uniref:Uncharacterized protein n=1 Tax=Phialophora macrospora TaxID=1851006 RepID=A0A0D2E212_9EURO|nr:hypothetical protein PV04_04315 [Phialophora macrospora]